MVFQYIIKVKGRILDPLSEIKILPSRLELTVDDLRKVEKDIQTPYGRELDIQKPGIITTDDRDNPVNLFELANFHGRTTHSRDRVIPNNNVEFGDVYAVKGCGLLAWSKTMEFTNPEGIRRKYPLVTKDEELNTRRIWGGETTELAQLQYVNALILNALIKRQGLAQSTYIPLRVVGIEELPIFENDRMRIVPLEEYCDDSFSLRNIDYVRVPTLKEAKTFAQLQYVGDTIDLRVLPKTFRYEDQRFHGAGSLIKIGDENTKKGLIDRLNKTFDLIRLVHSYGGSFSSPFTNGVRFSSLTPGNVSIAGAICDLDTLSFDDDGDLEARQEYDKRQFDHTLSCFRSMLFDPIK